MAAVASNPEAWMPLAAAVGESLLDNALDVAVLNLTTFPLHAAKKLLNEDYYGLGNDVGSGIYGAFQILTLFTGGGAAAKLATVAAKFAPKLGKLLQNLLRPNVKLPPQKLREIKGLKGQADYHKAKLKAYRKNPDAYDNKNHLKNNSHRRKELIASRIRKLKRQIDTFESDINNIKRGENEDYSSRA